MFNINELRSAVSGANGLTRPSHFFVMIQPPKWMRGGVQGASINSLLPGNPGPASQSIADELGTFAKTAMGSFLGPQSPGLAPINGGAPNVLTYFCDSAVLPGVVLNTASTKRSGIGPDEFYPIGVTYNEVPMTFMCDGAGQVMSFFHRWMQHIININPQYSDNTGQLNGAYPFEIYYKDDYATTINIIHLNESGQQIVAYSLQEAFPVIVADNPVNWATTDEILRLPVNFKFRAWKSTLFSPTSLSNGTDRGFSLLNTIIKAGTLASVVSMLKSPQNIGDALNTLGTGSLIAKSGLI